MSETRKPDPDEIPLPAIAQKEGVMMTLRCRTLEEAYLICDELEKVDILTILPDEEELLEQFRRCGFVEVRVSAKAYDSVTNLRSTVEFQYKRLRADRPLTPVGKLLGVGLGLMVCPGVLVFVWLLTSYRKNGCTRMARDLKFWFYLGIAILVLVAVLSASLDYSITTHLSPTTQ